MRLFRHVLAAAAMLASLAPALVRAQAPDVTVFAAASLKNALDQIAADFQKNTGKRVAISYGASSALARQIEQGAPADVFLSADLDWMNYLEQRRQLQAGTRRNLLGNRLVLVAPAGRGGDLDLKPGVLAAALGDGRLASASVASVPAGRYGKAALEHLGLWREVAGRLAEAENVRSALTFVARGEAPLGIVYETDARAEPNVMIVARFPETSHPPIVYPAAVVTSAKSLQAAAFLDALRSPASSANFAREGFSVLD